METILIIEDDPTLRLALNKTLRSAGYRVIVANTGPEGLAMALHEQPNLVLLDIMLPEMNGYEICEAIRKENATLPIIVVTAKGEEQDKVRGLRLGADDYVVKPFGTAELLARVETALRRTRVPAMEAGPMQIGALLVDFRAHAAQREGQAVEITALEMKLLRYLLKHEGTLLPRQRILTAVWGADYFGTDRTVDNFINRLRTKLEPDPKNPVYLVTVRGAGYRFMTKP